jgi:hypothetical protein
MRAQEFDEAYQGGLRKWFKEKWVNIGKKKEGGGHPECGTSGDKKGYAKCVPASKAASMSKKEKESATRRKRAAQNKAGRGGKNQPGQGNKPINVKTKAKEALDFHVVKGLNLHENMFRMGSDAYFELFVEARRQFNEGTYKPEHWFDRELVESTDCGEWATFNGMRVPLDFPISEENHLLAEAEYRSKDVELNKPKRGGSKKFYVYTKNPKTGNVVKVEFGAKGGGGNLAVKLRDPKARKAFADRHNCEQKKDKTKAGYWACRLPKYAKELGLTGGGSYFW